MNLLHILLTSFGNDKVEVSDGSATFVAFSVEFILGMQPDGRAM
jgi:hypothetical protein